NADDVEQYLLGILSDERGLEFLTVLIDGVARPEDVDVAAKNLRALAKNLPRRLRWQHRLVLQLGARASRFLPRPVVTIARRVIRRMVRHLIIDASPRKLRRSIAHIK